MHHEATANHDIWRILQSKYEYAVKHANFLLKSLKGNKKKLNYKNYVNSYRSKQRISSIQV